MPSPIHRFQIILLPAATLLALAGCGSRHDDEVAANTQTASISFSGLGNAGEGGPAGDDAQAVAVSVPGFSAKLNVPGVNLGGADTDIDGIRLHPGSRTTGMNITGAAGDGSGGDGHGTVELRFADPAPPANVLAYYRDAARAAGWREMPPAAGQQFAASKPRDRGTKNLTIQVAAAGTGSTGRLLVTGS